MTLSELHDQIERVDHVFEVRSVQPADIIVRAHWIEIEGQPLGITPAATDRLFRKVGAPSDYLRDKPGPVQVQLLDAHLRRGHFGKGPVTVVQRDRELFTLQDGGLIQLSGGEVLRSVIDGLETAPEGHGLSVTKVDDTGDRIELELVSPKRAVEVRNGDLVQGGLHIVHERFGHSATLIEGFTLRQICTNGMTMRECVSRDGIVRSRRLPAARLNARELQMDQIRRLTRSAWNALEPRLKELKATTERRVEVEPLLRQWLQRAHIRASRRLVTRLVSAWQVEGAENTQWAAINALTRVASHDQSVSLIQRRALASVAGLLGYSNVHLCPRCFSIVTDRDASQ